MHRARPRIGGGAGATSGCQRRFVWGLVLLSASLSLSCAQPGVSVNPHRGVLLEVEFADGGDGLGFDEGDVAGED